MSKILKNFSYSFPYYFARHIITANTDHRSKMATKIAVTGLSLSLLTVILTFSITNGFREELKQKIIQLFPSIYIYEINGYNELLIEDQDIISEAITANTGLELNLSVENGALLKSEDNYSNIILTNISNKLSNPDEEKLTKNSILISSTTAKQLNITKGDKIDLLIPTLNGIKLRRSEIQNIFDTHFDEYDKNYAIIDTDFIKTINSEFSSFTRLIVNISTLDNAILTNLETEINSILYSLHVQNKIKGNYSLGTIRQDAISYLGWLSLMDTNIIVITVLMTIIALFTLICSLTIIILEHIHKVAILKALGAPNLMIKKIFRIIGLRIIILSILIANVLAIILTGSQKIWHWLKLDPSSYYLDEVPMRLDFINMLIIDFSVILLALVAIMIPSRIVNSISPAKIIRYE